MRLVFRILGMTLLAGLVAATLAASVLSASATTLPQPAGCHRHSGHPVPAHVPDPVSYACCQTGHGYALLQHVPAFKPLVSAPLKLASIDSALRTASLNLAPSLITPSSSPPGSIPQRI